MRREATIRIALALALALATAPALARQSTDTAITPATRAPLPANVVELRDMDTRVLVLGYKLATGNVRYCADPTHTVGLLLHDVSAYADSKALRAILGLSSDIGVQALVPGGPADRAGLRLDDTVIAIGDLRVDGPPAPKTKPWERIEAIRAESERLLDETGNLPLTVLRDGQPVTLDIAGVPACRSRFEVADGSDALADGHRVLIGPEFVTDEYPDPLLAGLVAHEFAHNVLRHRAWFDANGGRKQKSVRLTEREADRLSPWLLANAGFDPRGAAQFWEYWGPRHGGWIFRDRQHDGWDERAENIAAEIPLIEKAVAAEGGADWSRHFRREKLPRQQKPAR